MKKNLLIIFEIIAYRHAYARSDIVAEVIQSQETSLPLISFSYIVKLIIYRECGEVGSWMGGWIMLII